MGTTILPGGSSKLNGLSFTGVGSLVADKSTADDVLGGDGRECGGKETGVAAPFSPPLLFAATGLSISQARHFILLSAFTTKHDEHFHEPGLGLHYNINKLC